MGRRCNVSYVPFWANGKHIRKSSTKRQDAVRLRDQLFGGWARIVLGASSLRRCRRGELLDHALYLVVRAIGSHGLNRIVIYRSWFQVIQHHTENRIGMTPVQPDVGFCSLALVSCTRAEMSYAEMLIVSRGVAAGPTDNGPIVLR
jgi:hypothetical protein